MTCSFWIYNIQKKNVDVKTETAFLKGIDMHITKEGRLRKAGTRLDFLLLA